MLQGVAIQKLHGDESLAVLLANVVNRADVGMVERGCSLGFALEAAECLRVAGHFVGQEFQAYKTVQPSVLGLVNHPHPAAAELFDNAVVRNCLVDHRREYYVGETCKSMNVETLTGVNRLLTKNRHYTH